MRDPRTNFSSTLLRFVIGFFCFLLGGNAAALSNSERQSYLAAQFSIKSQDYVQAIEHLDQIRTPSPQVVYMAAQVYLAQKKQDSAKKHFEELSEFKGWESIAWYYLAVIAEYQNQAALSQELHQKVITLNQNPELVQKSRAALTGQASVSDEALISAQLSVESIWDKFNEKSDAGEQSSDDMGIAITGLVDYQTPSHRWYGVIYDREQADLSSYELMQLGGGYEYRHNKRHKSRLDAFLIDSPTSQYNTYRLGHEYQLDKDWLDNVNFVYSLYQPDSNNQYLSGHRVTLKASGSIFPKLFWRYSIYKDSREDSDSRSYSPLVNDVSWFYQNVIGVKKNALLELWYENQQWPNSNERHAHGYGVRINYEQAVTNTIKWTIKGGVERYREYDAVSFDERNINLGAGLRFLF